MSGSRRPGVAVMFSPRRPAIDYLFAFKPTSCPRAEFMSVILHAVFVRCSYVN